ncbi:MAG: pilus assembly protein TadG-related protein [Terriglobales bacterium]
MTFPSSIECQTAARCRRGERGQTILLVAISIVSLLAMAALAIDVVSLYVARCEIQRSADTAALAGAKAMADSGVTTLQPTDNNLAAAEILAQSMAIQAINAIVAASPAVNQVAGGSPVLVGNPSFNWSQGNNNPQVTVQLQQANLPTFFARVFGSKSAIATATATAEAYNPSNLQSFAPLQTTCVKPWLIGNFDPGPTLPPNNNPTPFVVPATGQVENPAPLGETFWLSADCPAGNFCSGLALDNPPGAKNAPAPNGSPFEYFLPALITPNQGQDICPSATASPCGGGNDPAYKQAIECCNVATSYTCGGNVANASYDVTLNPEHQGANSDLALGTECLIHATGEQLGQGQDTLDWTTAPFPTGPPKITAGSGPQTNNLVSTSSSIVTIPIIDTTAPLPTTPPYSVTVVGFLQAFVNSVDNLGPAHRGDVSITVLNVIGCSQTPNAAITPVVGGNGASPIPVRLITP